MAMFVRTRRATGNTWQYSNPSNIPTSTDQLPTYQKSRNDETRPPKERRVSILLKCINIAMIALLIVSVLHFRPQTETVVSTYKMLWTLRRDNPLPNYESIPCDRLSPEERATKIRDDPRAAELHQDPLSLLAETIPQTIYFHQPKILLAITLKAGSVALLDWMYRGVTASPGFNRKTCLTYVHNVSSPCWHTHASFLHQLPLSQRWHLLTSDDVFRVGIQRHPYQRIVSAFKSKYSCDTVKFNSDLDLPFAHDLRRAAGFSEGPPCLELKEFATLLDVIRTKGGQDSVYKPEWIEANIRPFDLRHDIIDYDVILDSRYLVHERSVKFLYERLPFSRMVPPYVPGSHFPSIARLDIPDDVHQSFQAFANLSHVAPLKNCNRVLPVANQTE